MATLPSPTWPVLGALIAWCLAWAVSCCACWSLDVEALSVLFWERVTDDEALEVALAGEGARVGTGRQVASDLGAPWVFECLRLHCPSELLQCVRSTTCRGLVKEMRRPTHGAPEACLRGPADWCGVKCGPASLAYDRCRRASPCDEPNQESRALVMAQALSEADMAAVEVLEETQRLEVFATERRRFGDVRQGAAGHTVTFLTPALLTAPEHEALRVKLRSLMLVAAGALLRDGGRIGSAAGELRIRTAEHLRYAGPDAAASSRGDGLGWHHDAGSSLTMLAMLQPSAEGGGRLQSFVNCSIRTVGVLQRGDVAFYDSRMSHRVTEVRAPRRTLAVEWWRGAATLEPMRPTTPNEIPWPLQHAETAQLRREGRTSPWNKIAWTRHLLGYSTTGN